ncbi:MAG: hypothetical protein PHH77_07725 [Victivallaceae bacterium]|nr:hypothetical protein [Victivallaceae bacterium]
MSKVTQGEAVLNHGTVDEVWGFAENVNVADEADKKQIKNGEGDTQAVIYTDIRKKLTASFTPLAAGSETTPVGKADIIGSRLEIKTEGSNSIEIVVDSAEIEYKTGDVSTFKVEGYYYPELPAAT